MNLKEERNNPELFHADQQRVKSRKFGQNSGRRRVKAKINPELLELEGYIEWHFHSGKVCRISLLLAAQPFSLFGFRR